MTTRMMACLTLATLACGPTESEDTDARDRTSTTSTDATTTTTATNGTTTSTTGTSTTTVPCTPVGTNVGDCALDFELMDSDGQPWRLSDHVGDVILVDFSAAWCPICQNGARTFQQIGDDYGDQGFTSVTVMFQNVSGGQPTDAQLDEWTDAFGLTHPVLGDVAQQTFDVYDAGYQPTVVVIGRDHRITWVDKAVSAVNGAEAAVVDAL